MSMIEGSADTPVAVGIDAAVVANHHIVVRRLEAGRRGEVVDEFSVSPTVAGLDELTKRLASWPGVMAVAEPTSMSWLALSVALGRAGIDLSLLGNRHSARLRSAMAGKNKSDVIDAAVLSHAGEIFGLEPTRIPHDAELAFRRAAQRRGTTIIDANRCWRRVVSQARWAFPEVWDAFEGSRSTGLAVLDRWPHLQALARARTSSIASVVAANTRGVSPVDVDARAEQIRSAARRWVEFWDGHLDLDALASETIELLNDLAVADGRVARATETTRQHWQQIWGDDPILMSVPGMGAVTAPTVRAFLGDGTHLRDVKAAQSYVGLNPSNWSSGQMEAPSRAITKEGPPVLRLAFYQAANVARTHDPQLAEFYQRLMTERGHSHTKATCAVARKLVARTWTIITRGVPYEFRDLQGEPLTRSQAKALARSFAVPAHIRRRSRARSTATHRARLTN